MTWLLDLGNTRLKAAPVSADGRLGDVVAWSHEAPGFVAELSAWSAGIGPRPAVWLASVANAAVTANVGNVLREKGAHVHLARVRREFAGIRIAYPEPARLGVDRFLALVAAHRRGPGPWLLVSLGSAVTVDLLASDGRHLGGLIAASPVHHRTMLAARFPALDVDAGEAVVFADNTADAVASGVEASLVGMLELSWRRAHKLVGLAPTVLLSGGDAAAWRSALSMPSELAPTLVLEGLAIFAAGSGTPA